MPLVPATPRRERILIFGGDGVGKTDSWIKILEQTNSDFWVADADRAYWANVEEFNTIDHDRVHLWEGINDWTDFVEFAETALKEAKPDDWIVIDRLDHLRDAAINYWIQEVHGMMPEAWILETDKELERRNKERRGGQLGLDTEIDYRSINPYYYQYLNKLNSRAREQHLFMCASSKEIITEGGWRERNKAILDKFGDVGMKPQGGTGIGAIPNTVLYLRQMAGDRFVYTIKDRGRERKHKLDRARFRDFVTSYLMPVAKWRFEESNGNDEASDNESEVQRSS